MCTNNYCGSMGCMGFGASASSGGYVGCQRTMPVANLPCEDIRTTGTKTTVSSDSYLSGVALPFSFPFFGTARTTVLLSSSGAISFNTTDPYLTNQCLPYSNSIPMIAAYWEHMHTSGLSGFTNLGVYTQTIGTAPNRRFVIQWYMWLYSGGSTPVDVRVVLKEGKGDIDMCFVNTTTGSTSYDLGLSSTTGIQSGTGLAVQYGCNMANVASGLYLTYTAP